MAFASGALARVSTGLSRNDAKVLILRGRPKITKLIRILMPLLRENRSDQWIFMMVIVLFSWIWLIQQWDIWGFVAYADHLQ
jgi:hypothetical protein